MDELASLRPSDMHHFVRAGVEQDDEDALRQAPQALRDFFDNVPVPDWVDFEAFKPGQRAFHRTMTNMLIAYAVGSAVEGFGTMVAKSYSIMGRVPDLGPGAVQRLRQNNRHMIETYFPGGPLRDGDGWKVSTRIRFIHARTKKLLVDSRAWDHEAWGTPLSAAHIRDISLFTFSIRQFEHAMSMVSKITAEERASITAIWRYVGHILGVPEALLFMDEDEGRRLYRIAHLCEPPPDDDPISLANSVFKAIPVMAGLESDAEKQKLARYAYRLSHAPLMIHAGPVDDLVVAPLTGFGLAVGGGRDPFAVALVFVEGALVAAAVSPGEGPLAVLPAVAEFALVAVAVGPSQGPLAALLAGQHGTFVHDVPAKDGECSLAGGLAVHAGARPGKGLELIALAVVVHLAGLVGDDGPIGAERLHLGLACLRFDLPGRRRDDQRYYCERPHALPLSPVSSCRAHPRPLRLLIPGRSRLSLCLVFPGAAGRSANAAPHPPWRIRDMYRYLIPVCKVGIEIPRPPVANGSKPAADRAGPGRDGKTIDRSRIYVEFAVMHTGGDMHGGSGIHAKQDVSGGAPAVSRIAVTRRQEPKPTNTGDAP